MVIVVKFGVVLTCSILYQLEVSFNFWYRIDLPVIWRRLVDNLVNKGLRLRLQKKRADCKDAMC